MNNITLSIELLKKAEDEYFRLKELNECREQALKKKDFKDYWKQDNALNHPKQAHIDETLKLVRRLLKEMY